MEKTVASYLAAAPVQLPATHDTDPSIRVTELVVHCKRCGADTRDLRGIVTSLAKCLEIEAGGVCQGCRLVTFARIRWYGDHMLHWRDEGIVTHPFNRPLLSRLASWLRRFFVGR